MSSSFFRLQMAEWLETSHASHSQCTFIQHAPQREGNSHYNIMEWLDYKCPLNFGHAVKDQLNVPSPCDGARQNLLPSLSQHKIKAKIQNSSATKLIHCSQVANWPGYVQIQAGSEESFAKQCVIMRLLTSRGRRCNFAQGTEKCLHHNLVV